jgi:trigger factor
MPVSKNNLSASRVELTITVLAEDMASFAKQAAIKLSEKSTITGFRPGKAPYDVVKNHFGEMAITEEASHIAISKTIDAAIKEQINEEWIGQPEITIIKLAPNNDFEYKALVTLLPEVKLGNYKELKLTKEIVKVTDEEINKVVEHLQESHVKEVAVERGVENTDKVIVDIKMFLDKVPIEGGQGQDIAVIMGKDYVVPGFDENLFGAKVGEERSFTLHYPTGYHQKNLADKKVDFIVKIKDVFSRELPEVNDDFVLAFGLKNKAELLHNIKHSLEDEKKQEAEHKLEQEILEKIVKNSTIAEIPEILISNETETMLRELEYNVNNSGAKFADYLMSINKTPEVLKKEFLPQALERVKVSLVLRAIIKAENILVNDEEVDKQLAEFRKQYASDAKALEALNSLYYRRHLESIQLNRQAITKLISWNLVDNI